MNLKIGRFEIESDKAQFTIYEKRIAGETSKNPGEEINQVVGYYSTLESCLNAIPGHAVKRSDADNLRDVRAIIQEYKNLIKSDLGGV